MNSFYKNTNWKSIASIQVLNILFSLAGVLVKVASINMVRFGLLSKQTISIIFCYILLLAIYAFFWQKILKKIPLSTAYLNKGTLLFWSLLWAFLLLDETISIQNILGVAVIFCGVVLVSQNE